MQKETSGSVLTYGIAMSGVVLMNNECRTKVLFAQRFSVLRIFCALHTISNDALCIRVGMMPVEVVTEERKRLYISSTTG